jgi:hypothetical protein
VPPKTERDQEQPREPPEPPEHDRRLELAWPQLIGVPLIALVPVLAIAGVFGEHWTTRSAESARVGVTVEFPDRLRARPSKAMTVAVQNRSSVLLDTVEVIFDSTYVGRFMEVAFIPEARDAYVVTLTDIPAGATSRVHVELASDRVGRHAGRVSVRTRDDSVAIDVRTIVFP